MFGGLVPESEIWVERRIKDPHTGLTKKVVREPLSEVMDIDREFREAIQKAAAQKQRRKGGK
jgi:carbamoylphosphate synthase large subunit